MGKISLRRYNHEIESLIDQGNHEEAVAHCKYILQKFPKHVDTYRLLGKAYLESQRYSEAADILQRVLSVIPDDFVAHIGLSIVREDEGNLDAALWHIERAFEVQPSNAAIQEEIRRLYGRRDGVQISKVRLTRGALIRMYLQGELYDQAITETRSALSEDPQRMDLEVLLARMYYLSGKKVEAAEVCSQIIQKLPYCFEANKILAVILAGSGRSEDAKIFQQRIYSIEPYAAHVSKNTPSITQVADDAVTLEKISIDSVEKETDQPEWAQFAGIKLDETKKEELPEWLPTGKPSPSAHFQEEETYPQFDKEIEPIEEIEMPVQEDHIPDWMKAAGWARKDEETTEEVEGVFAAEEEEAVESKLPEWLRDLHPESSAIPAVEDEMEPELVDETQKMTISPGLSEDNGGEEEEIESLLDESGEESELMDTPDWLVDIEAAEKPSELEPELSPEVSEWLQIQNEQEESPGQISEAVFTEEAADSDEIDSGEWLKMLAEEHESEQEAESLSEDQIEIPDWITGKPAEDDIQEVEAENQFLVEAPQEEQETPSENGEESGKKFPDWFEELDEELPKAEGTQLTDAVPDWIFGEEDEQEETEISSAELENLEKESDVQESVTKEEPEAEDIDAAITWLESLSVSDHEEKETPSISPEESQAVAPQWMTEEEKTQEITSETEEEKQLENVEEESDEFSFTLSEDEIAPWQGLMDEEMPQIDEDIASSLSDIFGTSLPGSEPEPDLERASDEGEIIKDFDEVEKWTLQGEVSEEEETGLIIKEEEIVSGGEQEEELKSEEMVEEIFQILEEEQEEQGDQADQAPVEVESEPSGEQFETSSNLALEYANQALSRGEIDDALEQYAEFIQQNIALDEIIQNLKMALDRSPLDFNLWQTLGDAYARNNMLPDALSAYSKAEELLN